MRRTSFPRLAIAWRLPVACALCAALPDVDLLYMPTHRTATHSVPVAIVFTIVAAVVTGWVTPIRDWCRRYFGVESGTALVGLACGLAWSSHILLDWLGADANPPYGVQAFWPFSDQWFFSGVNLFPGTERRDPLSMRAVLINLRAAVQETVMMGSVAVAAWWISTRRTRVPTSGPVDRRRPSGAAAGRDGTSDRPGRRAGR